MIKKEFPNLQESYYEQRLENGLLVRVIPKKGFAKQYAILATDYGSIDTEFLKDGQRLKTPDGVAHYLEHKMFDLPEGNAMQAFSRLGASPNAFTSYTVTAYYVECTQNFEQNLSLLLRMVCTPYFTQESVEKERGIIAQEIKMYEDSPDSRVYENLFSAMYDTHPLRVPIAGTVDSIQSITAQILTDCHKTFYDPSNMVLCVAGDVDPERVIALAESLTPATAGTASRRFYGTAQPLERGFQQVQEQMEVSMPMFVVGFACRPPEKGEQTLRTELLGDLAAELLAGESTPVYTRLYEQGLIDCDFSGGYEGVKGAGLLSFSGDSKDPQAVLAAILDEAQRLCQEGLDEALFQRLKKSAMGRRTRSLDSFESCCYRCCSSVFDGVEYYKFPEIYQSITLEEAAKFLSETVRAERAAISIIYPKETEEKQP